MQLFDFEYRHKKLATPMQFAWRLVGNLLLTLLLIGAALALGMVGYRLTENMGWLDAFLNSSMLLGGMGPVDQLHTDGGKLFAGFYALFCGIVIIFASGVLLAPILHRVIHALHVPDEDDEKPKSDN
jgi:hypothetical protein